MSQSAAPAAYDKLLDLFDAAVTVDVAVVDADPGQRIPNEYLALTGIAGGEKEYAALAGTGLGPQREQFHITGEVCIYTGSAHAPQTKKVRDRAYAVLAAADHVVQTHVQLDMPDRVLWATVVPDELLQAPTQTGGRGAVLTFHISVSAYLT